MKLLTNKSQYQQEQSLYCSISNQNQIFKPNWQKPIHQLKKKKNQNFSEITRAAGSPGRGSAGRRPPFPPNPRTGSLTKPNQQDDPTKKDKF